MNSKKRLRVKNINANDHRIETQIMKREIIIEIERTTIICNQSAETPSNQNDDFIEVKVIEIPNEPTEINAKQLLDLSKETKNERKTIKNKG